MGAIHRVFNAGVEIKVSGGGAQETATALKVIHARTASSLAPAILISLTAYARIVIVLSPFADRGRRSRWNGRGRDSGRVAWIDR